MGCRLYRWYPRVCIPVFKIIEGTTCECSRYNLCYANLSKNWQWISRCDLIGGILNYMAWKWSEDTWKKLKLLKTAGISARLWLVESRMQECRTVMLNWRMMKPIHEAILCCKILPTTQFFFNLRCLKSTLKWHKVDYLRRLYRMHCGTCRIGFRTCPSMQVICTRAGLRPAGIGAQTSWDWGFW